MINASFRVFRINNEWSLDSGQCRWHFGRRRRNAHTGCKVYCVSKRRCKLDNLYHLSFMLVAGYLYRHTPISKPLLSTSSSTAVSGHIPFSTCVLQSATLAHYAVAFCFPRIFFGKVLSSFYSSLSVEIPLAASMNHIMSSGKRS